MATSREEFVNLCYEQYAGNTVECEKISTFERTYQPSDAIRWYAREPFVFEILNKALRTHDVDTVFKLRFLLRDIYDQLYTEQINYFLELEAKHEEEMLKKMLFSWRGQKVSLEEFDKLRSSQGEYVSMNSFFSTSQNKQVALMFAQSNDKNKISILFHIESDICSIYSKPFAHVAHLSPFAEEEEILFMAGAIFQITDIYYDDKVDHCWIIKLVLSDEKNTKLHELLTYLIDEILPVETNLMNLGNVLMRMGLFDKAEQYYQRHLESLPPENQISLIHLYLELTKLAELQTKQQLSRNYLERAIDLILNRASNIDRSVQDFLHNLRCHLDDNQQFNYNQMYQLFEACYSDYSQSVEHDELKMANHYTAFGNILRAQGKLQHALANLEKSLEIQLKLRPENHPTLAQLYEDIGNLHLMKKDYTSALIPYQRALVIRSASLPPQHPDITKLHDIIAEIFKQNSAT